MADWDFIGFTYNGYHSIRDLGIYRTSNGNRYDDNLTATMTDKTVDVPGGDGQYYFGTTFKNRTFTVNYAFDMLTEAKIRTLKEVFCGDGIHDLVFDERPYVAWSAKVTGTASMKHLCFEEDGQRVYKGEGSITFTCYYPYGHTPRKLWIKERVWDYNANKYATDEKGSPIYATTYREMDGKILHNYTSDFYPNKEQWAMNNGFTFSFALAHRLSQPGAYGMEGLGITKEKSYSYTPTLTNKNDFYAIILFDYKFSMYWGDSLVFYPIKEILELHRRTGSVEIIPFKWEKALEDGIKWDEISDITAKMRYKQGNDYFYDGGFANNAGLESYCFSSDISPILRIELTNKSETTLSLPGLAFGDEQNKTSIIFASTLSVGKDKSLIWDGRTGLLTYDSEVIPVSGNTFVRLPHDRSQYLSAFDIYSFDGKNTSALSSTKWTKQYIYDYLYR